MDLRYFQSELNKYPIKRRSDYCKSNIKKTNSVEAPLPLTESTFKSDVKVSSVEDTYLDFWDYMNSKLESENLHLSASEKNAFKKTLMNGHKTAIANLNLEDLEVMADVCIN
jgi:hypothetical protein